MEEMTFQDILREKQILEYRYSKCSKKIYKKYNRLNIIYCIISLIGFLVFVIGFSLVIIITLTKSAFLSLCLLTLFCFIFAYMFYKFCFKLEQKLLKAESDVIKKLNKKIHKKMKKKYDVKAYPDHICFNGNIYVHPNNWRCYIYDENNQNFYAFSYHYKEGKTEISDRYTITGKDFLDIWQHRHEWIMINNEKGEEIIDDRN